MTTYHLAQLNVGRLVQPLDHPDMAEFTEALGPINELAEASPGFVWRLTDESGQSSSYVSLPEIEDPQVAFNYSVWESLDALRGFVFKTDHVGFLRRRTNWFEPMNDIITVCWWTPAGNIPPLDEAYQRLLGLRADGASESGWPMSAPMPQPQA